MERENPLIEMKGISKKFGKVEALKGVNFTINYDEVAGLVGDNGAGKSTLIKILSGIYQQDEGKIYKEGREVTFLSRKDSMNLGIETIYQDAALVDQMSVLRNMFLGREITFPFGFLDKRSMGKKCLEVLNKSIGIAGIKSPDQVVGQLSGGQKQAVATARAIYFKTKILLLDEPTSALSIKESQKILDYVQQLKEEGISSVFVTHNLYHVYPVSDRFVVLSHGRKIKDVRKRDTSIEELSKIIVSS